MAKAPCCAQRLAQHLAFAGRSRASAWMPTGCAMDEAIFRYWCNRKSAQAPQIVNAVRLAGCVIICWARVWGSGARWLHGPQAPAPWKGANSAQHQSGVTRDCGSPCELEAEFFPERFLDLCFGSRVVRLVQVIDHLLLAGQPHEEVTHHLHRAFVGLSPSLQLDDQAGDHRAIHLDFHALRPLAEQVPHAQDLLEEAEE